MNKYSIFLPVHNGGKFIRQCIESIISQTYNDFNLEILENKSNDGTYEYLRTLSDKRIRVWPSDKLLSIEDNWKRILSIPKNTYMTIIGHDDILYSDYLDTMNEMISNNPDAKLYQSHFDLIDENSKVIRECWPMPAFERGEHFLALRMSQAIDSFGTGYVMRSEDYISVGGIPDYKKLLFADDALWIKIVNNGYIDITPRKCFAYRFHHQSASHTLDIKDFYNSLKEYVIFLSKIKLYNSYFFHVIENNLSKYIHHYLGNTIYSERLINSVYPNSKRLNTKSRIAKLLRKILN